jgi:rhodanese-related sulfurtransferase/predicted metal-dependent enzyme (double-stranded beta helix superfamily)
MTTQNLRAAAVTQAVEKIRAIASTDVSRPLLEKIKSVVVDLALRRELFAPEQFPLGDRGQPRIYYLAQDPDGQFAVYASVGAPGKAQPPHNHTTWAVISGVYGDEHNVLYRRLDDGGAPGAGALERVGEITVRSGNAIGLLPNDFHTIEVTGADNSLHLHVYGRSLEQLPGRITFEGPSGGKFRAFPANPNITSPRLGPADLKTIIAGGEEFALLDVRDEDTYARGHAFFATCAPLERFDDVVGKLVPRRSVCTVLCDALGQVGGLADLAAAKLRTRGFTNVSILAGGIEAWKEAGYELFSGLNVPSKAFGEAIECRYATPHIDAKELKEKLDAGERVVVLDSRPIEEFENMSIPGSLDCPGAELVYRAYGVTRDPGTLVVVNCAGRTRSIIGAQSLINAGFDNVVALRNGTMGWQLAGFDLDHGADRRAPAPDPESLSRAREAARTVAARFNVRTIDVSELARLQADGQRSLYLFDVRTPDEYRSGHLPGARSAPGGQLMQATDVYVGVHRARIVLVDDDGVRARLTASWLSQMGDCEVFVLDAAQLAFAHSEIGGEGGWMPDFASTRSKPYASPEAMTAYLRWETSLLEQVRRDGDAPFLHLLQA